MRHMLVQAGIVDTGIMDSLHKRFQALDEDGSGCLTAADLKTEPLGLKPTCNATDVSDKALVWPRAVSGASSRASQSSSKWGRISSRSNGRQESTTLSISSVDALPEVVLVDDRYTDSQLHISVINESQTSKLNQVLPNRKSVGAGTNPKSALVSPRSPGRFVEDVSVGTISKPEEQKDGASEIHVKRPSEFKSRQEFEAETAMPTTKKTSEPNPENPISKASPDFSSSVLSAELEGVIPDSSTKSQANSRRNSHSTSPGTPSSRSSSSTRPGGSTRQTSPRTSSQSRGSTRASTSSLRRATNTSTMASATATTSRSQP